MSYFSSLCFSVSVVPPPPLSPPKKIDEENEANLLAVLTETLDSIPVDEDGLPSFEALADGDVTNASDQSCPSSPDGSPRTPEPEEPSLVRPAAGPPRRRVQPASVLRRDLLNRLPSVAPAPVCGRHEISLFHQAGHRTCLVDPRFWQQPIHTPSHSPQCARV